MKRSLQAYLCTNILQREDVNTNTISFDNISHEITYLTL